MLNTLRILSSVTPPLMPFPHPLLLRSVSWGCNVETTYLRGLRRILQVYFPLFTAVYFFNFVYFGFFLPIPWGVNMQKSIRKKSFRVTRLKKYTLMQWGSLLPLFRLRFASVYHIVTSRKMRRLHSFMLCHMQGMCDILRNLFLA